MLRSRLASRGDTADPESQPWTQAKPQEEGGAAIHIPQG